MGRLFLLTLGVFLIGGWILCVTLYKITEFVLVVAGGIILFLFVNFMPVMGTREKLG